MTLLRALALSSLLVTADVACHPDAPPRPPPSAATCPSACARLREMRCELGNPTPRGVTCEVLCTKLQSYAVDFLGCVSSANDCASAENCSED